MGTDHAGLIGQAVRPAFGDVDPPSRRAQAGNALVGKAQRLSGAWSCAIVEQNQIARNAVLGELIVGQVINRHRPGLTQQDMRRRLGPGIPRQADDGGPLLKPQRGISPRRCDPAAIIE